ncbi:MAG: cation:proton antiporter [Anaerolineales bacterium]|nr:cation:proton antiporter [Anaerolineales bacterium]
MDLIWIVAAFAAGLVAKMVKLPTLVGYLAAGLVLALWGVQSNEFIKAVGDFGVVLLLFTVGLHISLRSLVQPQVVGVGVIHLVVSTAVFAFILFVLQLPPFAAVVIAAVLSFSSTVLTAKTLDAQGELDSYHGRLAIGILILQDVVAVVLLALAGGGTPSWWALGLLALPLARPFLLKLMYAVGHEELLLLYGLLLALSAGWLFDLVGLDAKLGALVSGMLLAGDPRSDELYDKLWGLKEVFLVGFFLQVGLAGIPDGRGWLIIGLLLLTLPLKAILFFGLMLLFKLRARTAFLSTISLTAFSEFALIVVAGATAVGLIEEQYVVIVGLLVALSYVLNAPFSRSANALWQRLEHILIRFERDVRHPDHEPRSLGAADYVVVGMGRAGTAAYDYLIEQGKRPVGFEADPAQIQRHLQNERRVIYGDANDPELWTDLNLSSIEGVLITLSHVTAEITAAHNLRAEGYDGFIAALLRYSEDEAPLSEAGVTVSFLPIAQAGRELAQASLGQTTAPLVSEK